MTEVCPATPLIMQLLPVLRWVPLPFFCGEQRQTALASSHRRKPYPLEEEILVSSIIYIPKTNYNGRCTYFRQTQWRRFPRTFVTYTCKCTGASLFIYIGMVWKVRLMVARHLRDDGQLDASGNKTEMAPLSIWYAVDLKSGRERFCRQIWDIV